MKKTMSIPVIAENGETVEYIAEADGLFMYKDNMSANDSIHQFVTEFHHSSADFNACYGAYRFSLSSENGRLFFADNSGMMRYYHNTREQKLYHSLAEAEKEKENRVPNYSAIAQYLSYGCTYNNETITQSVVLSDPSMYYIMEGNQLISRPKGLKPLVECKDSSFTLNKLIAQAVAHCDGKIGCTITGGVDSRAVLANLISLGVKPQLAITGHESQADVVIAKEIAKETGLELSVLSDSIEEKDWLEDSVEAADGRDGICGVYRLDKLAKHLRDQQIVLQFGGVAGEMYKNSFINQDFPFYIGKPRWKRFYKFKVGTFDISRSLTGDKIRGEIDKLPETLIPWLSSHKGRNKAEAYLDAGYEIMQSRCNLIVNMFQRYTTSYNPLMERKMAAYAFGINPYKLEMQAFQRREVSEHCPSIKNIRTDRDLTCDYGKKGMEFLKSYLYLIRIAMNRVLFRNKVNFRVDPCFEEGHQHESFFRALECVKRIGVLNPNARKEEIPVALADNLFMVGLFFEKSTGQRNEE